MAVNVKGGALEFDALINIGNFEAQIKQMQQLMNGLANTAQKEADNIDQLIKRASAAVAGYLTFAAGKEFIGDLVRTRGEFQQLEVAFNTMLGSKEKADKLMAEVTQFAATTPFELKEVAGATRSLLAFGVSADKIKPTLKALGDVSAGVGAPIQEIAEVYGKARVQGRLFAEDINQLTGRGIPIIQELAKQFGVADDQVKKLVENGQVGFPQIEKAFQDLTSAGSTFGGLMEAQSKTLTGQLSNLSDAWNQMLNNIGKSNENIFSGAIGAAIDLVNNYETVLDVIKVLILTYGSYKAAVITTTAVQAIATSVTQGYTIAETLRFQAMLLSEKAMKLLNATMLNNPAVAITTGIVALIATLVIFRKEAGQVKTAAELMNTAQKKAADSYADQQAKILPYLEILKAGNVSEQQRLDIYSKIRAIDPDIIKGLDAKSLSYENLKKNVDKYLDSLRNQLAIEANQEAITASIKQEQIFQKQIDDTKKRIASLKDISKNLKVIGGSGLGTGSGADQTTNINLATSQLSGLEDQLKAQKQVTEELGKQGAAQTQQQGEQEVAKRRTVDIIQNEIKALKDQRDKVSATSAEYGKFTDQIKKLEVELESITGKDAAKSALKDAKDAQKELLDLLKDISKAEDDSRRSVLSKEQAEVDKINQRYDELKKRAQQFSNNFGLLERIESARIQENSSFRQDNRLDQFKNDLKTQVDIFTKYEELKVQVGEQKAKELTNFQTGNYEDVIDFLKAQLKLAEQDFSNLGVEKRSLLAKSINQAENDKAKQDVNKQIEDFKRVSEATVTFNIKRKQLETQYQKDVAALQKNFTGEELATREAALKESHEKDLADLDRNLKLSAPIFKKMAEDLLFFTRDQLKARAKELQQYLKQNANLPPEVKQQILSTIEQINNTLKQDSASQQIVKDFSKVSDISQQVSSEVGKLADAFRGLDDNLADILSNISQIANIAGNAAGAVANFASGNISGGISSTVSVISGVIGFFKQAKQSRQQAQQQVQAFNDQVAKSEEDITLLYRERQREQVKLNKLKLQGILDENKLLQDQKKANAQQYQEVLTQLQAQVAVIGKGTKTSGGVFGIGKKTSAVDITESLAGKSFADLEKLFLSGQLQGKAKDLFEELQKIKQEGVDIDKLLADNAEAAREMITGTTADSITDSIIDGFKNGLRSAKDFADDFQSLMQNAVLQSLKFQALEGPLNDFFKQFSDAAASDNILTDQEINQLQANFDGIITNAGQKFEELQKITNLDFTGNTSSSGSKSLTGAIKGMTEQQAELLAGQFGGLRLTALDQLKVASSSLNTLQAIQNNTARLIRMDDNLQWFRLNGLHVY